MLSSIQLQECAIPTAVMYAVAATRHRNPDFQTGDSVSIPITIKWGVKDKVKSQPEVGGQKANRLQVANTLAKRKDALGNTSPKDRQINQGQECISQCIPT